MIAVLVAVVGLGGWAGYLILRPAGTFPIAASYAFDVTDRRQVAGFADHVFVGTVTDIVGVDRSRKGPPATIWQVEVAEVLKGSVSGSVRVVQYGARIGRSTWVMDGVTPLAVGQVFLLAVTDSSGRLLSVGGPSAPERADSATDRARLIARWGRAVAEQRWPDNLPR